MGGAKKSTWVGGTVFVAVLILVAAWFLAVSPTMAAAADLRAQADQAQQQNELLEIQVAKLKADFEKLPEYKAELAAIQTQIPTDAKLADYLRQLDQIAVAHSVTLTAISPSVPTPVVIEAAPVEAAAVDPATTPPAEGAATDPAAAPVAAAPVGPVAPAGFMSIGFSITALGTFDNTQAFLYDLQRSTPRLFLVTGVTGTSQGEQPASGGKPATQVGDQEIVITGVTYMLPDMLAVPAPVDPAAPAPSLPGAVPGKNPLVPITGH